MKIALICPSNMLYMPYVKNYEQILIEQNIDYDIINWDRFQMEEISDNTFRDKKKGHQRNFYDYLKYKRFLVSRLSSNSYDKIIVFGIQLSYFLKKIIQNKYRGKSIIDIRDHNMILNFFKIKGIIEGSVFTVLSSPGYTEWLPESNKYVINHNTHISSINELKEISFNRKEKICISNIGAIRDFQVNKDVIDALKNSERFQLNFHGEGVINRELNVYSNTNQLKNVFITGRYKKEEEAYFYHQSDLINVLRYNDGRNNKTALPNRLYHAILYGKPLFTFDGTALANEIKRFNLGLVLSSMDDLEQKIANYLHDFDVEVYEKGRAAYIHSVIEDNKYFNKKVVEFVSSS